MSDNRRTRYPHVWLMAVAACVAAPLIATGAQAADDDELAELVRRQAAMLEQQSAQIEQLRTRLADVERRQQTQPPTRDEQPRGSDRVVRRQTVDSARSPEAEADDTRDRDSIEALQSRVALLEAGNASQSGIDWSDGAPEFISPDGERSFKLGGRLPSGCFDD